MTNSCFLINYFRRLVISLFTMGIIPYCLIPLLAYTVFLNTKQGTPNTDVTYSNLALVNRFYSVKWYGTSIKGSTLAWVMVKVKIF